MSIGYVETPEQELRRLREQNRQWLEESTKLLAELEQLRKENERLRAEREEDQGVIAVWRGRTQRAEAEIERLRADAERYRWLREYALAMDTVADPDNFVQIWVGTDPASCFKARTLDAAIDAAMQEGKP